MCIAIPGRILEIRGDKALADFRGEKKTISLKFVKAKKGDYIICAGDVAAEKIPKQKAEAILNAMREK